MMETNIFTQHLAILFVILISITLVNSTVISNKRLCYNRECSEPIAKAKTLMKYTPNGPGLLGFDTNVEVVVFSKSAGNRTDLWGVEINGKRGYVPHKMLREYKVLKKDLDFEVPTELFSEITEEKLDLSNVSVESSKAPDTKLESTTASPADKEVLSFDNVTPSYEVFEGTTLNYSPNEEPQIEIEATENPAKIKESEEQPILSIHPSIVTRGLDFVSGMINRISQHSSTETLDDDNRGDKEDEKESSSTKEKEIREQENLKQEDYSQTPPVEDTTDKHTTNLNDEVKNSDIKTTIVNDKLPEIMVEKEKTNEEHVEKDTIPSKNEIINNNDEEKKNIVEDIKKDVETSKNEIIDEVKEEASREVKEEVENVKEEVKNLEPITETQVTENVGVVTTEIPQIEKIEQKEMIEKSTQTEQNTEIHNQNPQEIIQQSPQEIIQQSPQEVQINKSEQDFPKIEEQTVVENLNVDNSTIKVVSETTEVPVQNTKDSLKLENEQLLDSTDRNLPEVLINDSLITESSVTNDSAETSSTVSSEFLNEQVTTEIPLPVDQTNEVNTATERTWVVNDLLNNRNLLNVNDKIRYNVDEADKKVPIVSEVPIQDKDKMSLNIENITKDEHSFNGDNIDATSTEIPKSDEDNAYIAEQAPPTNEGICEKDQPCPIYKVDEEHEESAVSEDSMVDDSKESRDYWEGVIYVSITAVTTLLFSLGYYYIENSRRDSKLIAKINELERDLMVATKECTILSERFKTTATKLFDIEHESVGSNEMVVSLKTQLDVCKDYNTELERQVTILEKELESASEAGLELERMLREVLSSHNDDNPLTKSIEDLQTRLNVQQAANESLTNALNIKVQENESLSANFIDTSKKCEALEHEVRRLMEEVQTTGNLKIYMEQNLSDQIQRLETQFKAALDEKNTLRNELKEQEQRVKELSEVIEQYNVNNLDFEKLFEVAHVKAEVAKLTEERDELKIKLSEVEGAHQLLEEHMKIVDEQIATFGEQCKIAEKEKKEAETRLEVLSNYFKEKEAQRQKEEALWMQQQGEVASTVERIQTMQNEIHNYRQQVEILKREIVDQEKEYKSQIAALETKSHEQWVLARQNERRLEESKAEASQLRNRLTLVEKNLYDADPESKLHRLEANGESATSPALFLGVESSSSPIMFAGSGGMPPPPPPNFMYGPPFAPFLPPPPHNSSGMHPYEVGQRPPPLGARLSSPPPMSMQPPLPPMSPMSPPLPSPYGRRRSPPLPIYASDHPGHPPLPPPSLLSMPLESLHPHGEESLPHIRNSGYSTSSQHQRDQRTRNHKGSLHSSGESLDKSHHSGKV